MTPAPLGIPQAGFPPLEWPQGAGNRIRAAPDRAPRVAAPSMHPEGCSPSERGVRATGLGFLLSPVAKSKAIGI